jgi:hypothetical protein
MLQGSPLPLSPDVPLSKLLACARPAEPLGAWLRSGAPRLLVCRLRRRSDRVVLASSDLGLLLRRCTHVALREGKRTSVLRAETVIHWRALQVVTAMPYLPAFQRLKAQLPQVRASLRELLIPLGLQTPEEVLARCVAEGIRVAGSRIVYLPSLHLPPLHPRS